MSLTVGEITNEKELIAVAEALRQERLQARAPFEAQWWNNIALVAGEHYTYYEPTTREFVTLDKEPHEVRLVLNQARVVARTELAKITKSRPVMDIIARSPDEEDIAATRVGRFALDSAEWMFKLRRRRKAALWWTILCGVSGIYVGFDPQDDRPGFMEYYIDPNTGDPVFHPDRIKQLEEESDEANFDLRKVSYPLGDLEYKVYTPFQLLPNDTVMDWEDITDIIVTDVVELSRARDQWEVSDLSGEDARPGNLGQRLLRRVGLGGAPSMNTMAQSTVQVHTWWLKPGVYSGNKFLRDGLMLRWAYG